MNKEHNKNLMILKQNKETAKKSKLNHNDFES